MSKTAKLKFMKATCWLGIVVDGLWTIALLSPVIFGALTGRPDFEADVSTRLVMGIGASLMAGWTFLLVWTLFEPIARKGVFLLTACPVITGLGLTTLFGLANGTGGSTWILVKLIVLVTAMMMSFFFAGSLDKEAGLESSN